MEASEEAVIAWATGIRVIEGSVVALTENARADAEIGWEGIGIWMLETTVRLGQMKLAAGEPTRSLCPAVAEVEVVAEGTSLPSGVQWAEGGTTMIRERGDG